MVNLICYFKGHIYKQYVPGGYDYDGYYRTSIYCFRCKQQHPKTIEGEY